MDRTAGQKGFCGIDDTVRCFREVLYYDEESELNPSHQIHLAGCNLRCEFCAVAEWNQEPVMAKEIDYDCLVRIIARRESSEGAKTLNFLGGEPTVNLHGVLELLGRVNSRMKVVWNSNMYYNSIVDELTAGVVDIYLADFKCGSSRCARELLGADDYIDTVKGNILKAAGHSDVIIRHLVMPGHSRCCLKPILEWIAAEAGQVRLSLRGDYVPPAESRFAPEGYVSEDDMQRAVGLAEEMGLRLVR